TSMEVIAYRELRPKPPPAPGQPRERNRITRIVTDVELADIFRFGAKWAIGLKVALPGPSKSVEIVDKRPAHEDLDGLVHIGELNPLLQDFVLINVEIKLRNIRQQSGGDPGNFWALSGFFHEFLGLSTQKVDIHPGAILQEESHPSRCSDPRDCRRRKNERNAFRNLRQRSVGVGHHGP